MIEGANFTPTQVVEHPFGREILFENCRLFFGNRHGARAILQNHFKNLDFFALKQVHGNEIVESRTDGTTGDGHWTVQPRRALMIITADCMPVLFWTKERSLVGAVHAGWRGVVGEIVPKMMELFIQQKISVSSIGVAIGAHIRAPSFFVDNDVKNQLSSIAKKYSAQREIDSIVKFHSGPNKYTIDLTEIVFRQLEFYHLSRNQVWLEPEDTFTNGNFQSYRREGAQAGRQFSFISSVG